jgi:calnexin
VRFNTPLECGGAYIKLLHTAAEVQPTHAPFASESFSNETPYVIMFGPDKCGDNNKVHFIFRHKNPLTGAFEEKHLKTPPRVPLDKKSHLYTLVLRTDETYDVMVDGVVKAGGSLLEDFTPAVNPPAEIDDPTDSKPADWVDAATIPDPAASKPEDWDESQPALIPDPAALKPDGWQDDGLLMIPDPSALQPADWNVEEDGDWEAPSIKNPVCVQVRSPY